jgi:hypothetical protein
MVANGLPDGEKGERRATATQMRNGAGYVEKMPVPLVVLNISNTGMWNGTI